MSETSDQRARLLELGQLFLKLGILGFGGPAAHISMMEEEVVRKRKWLSAEDFLDLLSATNLIPGPNSTEMALHIGHRRAGFKGLLVAGFCFIVPAMIIVLAIAALYVQFGELPKVQGVLRWVKPVLVVIVWQAFWSLFSALRKNRFSVLLVFVSGVLCIGGLSEILIFLIFGLINLVYEKNKKAGETSAGMLLYLKINLFPKLATAAMGIKATQEISPFAIEKLFLFFLKVGAVLYGSGYVLISFLESTLVYDYGWLSKQQLIDAISVGQFTPGPVFTTATFVGFLLAGFRGAVLSTIAIFLPSFVFVAASSRLIPMIRSSPVAGHFLAGVNAASIGVLAAAAVFLSQHAVVDMLSMVICVLSFFMMFQLKWKSTTLVAIALLCGLIFPMLP